MLARTTPRVTVVRLMLLGLCVFVAAETPAIGASSSTGAIRACVSNQTGQVRIVGSRARCGRREHAVVWNTRGAPGSGAPSRPTGAVAGAPGPQGGRGPQGDQGRPGSSTPTYDAGLGLQLTGNTFSVDFAQTQARLTGDCARTLYMFGVDQDGTPRCDFPSGNITRVATSGGLLTGGGNSGTVTLGLDDNTVQRTVNDSCNYNRALTGVDQGWYAQVRRRRQPSSPRLSRPIGQLAGR